MQTIQYDGRLPYFPCYTGQTLFEAFGPDGRIHAFTRYAAESTEKHRVWHLGLPPFTGWWNCSTQEHPDCWRWFDAETKRLSHAVHAKAPPTAAEQMAFVGSADIRYRTFMQEHAIAQGWPDAPDIHVAWNDYWPRHGVLRIWPGGEGQW